MVSTRETGRARRSDHRHRTIPLFAAHHCEPFVRIGTFCRIPQPTIAQIDLVTEGRVPGLDQEQFVELANQTQAGCPVSRALAGVGEITLDAKLVG
jgi:hypothetical protein